MSCFTSLKILTILLLPLIAINVAEAQEVAFLKKVSDKTIHISERSIMVKILFEISDGFHIQSSKPINEFVIPTKIDMEWPAGVTAHNPLFPKAEEMVLEGAVEPLYVYSGLVEVTIAINYGEDTLKGEYEVPGIISYQACDHKRCFYPRELNFVVNVVLT